MRREVGIKRGLSLIVDSLMEQLSRHLRSVMTGWILCVGTAFPAHADSTDEPSISTASYPVIRSELAFSGKIFNSEKIYWIDNDNVIVPAYVFSKDADPVKDRGVDQNSFGLYIWNVKNNTYKLYTNKHNSTHFTWFSYDHGNIAYTVTAESEEEKGHGKWPFMIGKMGEEQRIVLNDGSASVELRPSRGSSSTVRREPDGNQSELITLLPGKGYIYVSNGPLREAFAITPQNENNSIKLYPNEQAEPIELPIMAKEAIYGKLSYSDYLDEYLLIPGLPKDQSVFDIHRIFHHKGTPYIFYLISPQGEVETQSIPAGYWRPEHIFPTKEGIFWSSIALARHHGELWAQLHGGDEYADAGGWLMLRDGKIIKLFSGYVVGSGVSPDGCTIAYQTGYIGKGELNRLSAINLCMDNKGK